MNFSSESGEGANAGVVCPTLRLGTEQLRADVRPLYQSRPAALDTHCPTMTDDSTEAGNAREAEDRQKRYEDAREKLMRLRGSKKVQASLGWLERDPSEWLGRKIRSRKTGKVYVVRSVLTNGQVELEKSWMTYFFFVWAIRAEFEPYA